MPVRFAATFGATETVERLARPGLRPAARAVAQAIPTRVPVHTGGVKRTYKPTLDEQDDSIHVHVGSPFWHWLEYGTQFNPAYRPVENAVRSLGLRYEARSA